MSEEIVEPVTPETTDTEQPETPKTYSEEEVAELRKKAELADNYKIRAEKAEKKAKEDKQPDVKKELTTLDVLYLSKTDIHEEDLQEVLDEAKLRGITVKEAHTLWKPILAQRQEERNTAQTARGAKQRSGAPEVTGKNIIDRINKGGEIPETEEEMDKLADARFLEKMKGRQS